MPKTMGLVVGLLVAGRVASPSPDALASSPRPDAPAGVTAWLAGDAAQAARELQPRTDREGALNRAIALLYAGEASAAWSELVTLHAREPRWVPALRWLARAQAEVEDSALDETLEVLLADGSAESRDFLWAGRLRLDAGENDRAAAYFTGAVAREPDLYLGWLWLGDAEDGRGRCREAREAWLRARALHAGGDVLTRLGRSSLDAGHVDEGRALLEEALRTPEGRRSEGTIRRLLPDLPPAPPAPSLAPLTTPGERLRYTARYLFFRFATLEIWNQGWTELRGHRALRLVFSVRSNKGFPLIKIDSRFESFLAEDGSVLAHRSLSRDSTQTRRAAAYEMDPTTGECVVREVVEGLFGFDRFPLPAFSQDGVSVLQLARALAGTPGRLSVLTAVDSTWKGTELRTRGTRRMRWDDRKVDTVEVESVGHYKGPAGLSGKVRAWISRDSRAVPYRASIKVALGSVVLTLRPESEETEPPAEAE